MQTQGHVHSTTVVGNENSLPINQLPTHYDSTTGSENSLILDQVYTSCRADSQIKVIPGGSN